MPGTTTADLSSNWKKLQAKLQAEKKPADSAKTSTTTATGNGIKRKRPVEKTSSTGKPAPRYIEAKLTGDNTSTLGKKRKMGSTMSSSTTEQPAPKPHSSLMTDHDIPAADLAAAYGSSVRPNSSSKANANSMFDDTINGGLHPSHRAGKYLALDCEMVGTGPPPHTDDLLARVSLVNFHGEQIYDSYVLPPSKNDRVGDYRTHVSGITPWHLRPGYARPFLEVQRTVADLLNDKILVGHALKKDMEALQLTHPKRDVRDTSRYAPFRVESRGKPPALRNLAKSELGLVIQTGEHSSVEDARATMALFRKEKQGFEEDNRRTFGTKRRVPLGKGKREESVEKDSDEEDEDSEDDEDMDEEDLDLLEGEEDPFAGMDDDGMAAKKKKAAASTNKKKKKKKKSRTKRK